MRILFIGQAPFGADALKTLLEKQHEIVGVVTVPDAPNQKYPNPVKEAAEKASLPLLQSRLLKNPEAVSWVRERRPDLLVLAFVTSFVPREMIELAPLGGINYHPSLLPRYRGGSAINWAVINGETETGVTIHFIDEGVDTGPILLQEAVAIDPDDTVKSLYFGKLYPMGIRLIGEAVQMISEGRAEPMPQDESLASFQPLITPADTIIDWSRPTAEVYNLIRGANPAPGASSTCTGTSLKLLDSRKTAGSGEPGSILAIDDKGVTIATGDGAILVEIMQPPAGKKIPAPLLAEQHHLAVGDTFGAA